MCGAHLDGASHPRGSCVHPRLGRVVGGFHQPPKLGRGQGSAVTPRGLPKPWGPCGGSLWSLTHIFRSESDAYK